MFRNIVDDGMGKVFLPNNIFYQVLCHEDPNSCQIHQCTTPHQQDSSMFRMFYAMKLSQEYCQQGVVHVEEGNRYWTEVRETEFLDCHEYQPPTQTCKIEREAGVTCEAYRQSQQLISTSTLEVLRKRQEIACKCSTEAGETLITSQFS